MFCPAVARSTPRFHACVSNVCHEAKTTRALVHEPVRPCNKPFEPALREWRNCAPRLSGLLPSKRVRGRGRERRECQPDPVLQTCGKLRHQYFSRNRPLSLALKDPKSQGQIRENNPHASFQDTESDGQLAPRLSQIQSAYE